MTDATMARDMAPGMAPMTTAAHAAEPAGATGATDATAGSTMTVGLDVSSLVATRTGIGRYTYELLAALWTGQRRVRILPLGHRSDAALPAPRAASSAGSTARGVRGPHLPSRATWTFGLLPFWLPRAGIDVFHGTSYYAPIGGGVPTVITVHDLSTFACPEHHPRARVFRAHAMLPRLARHAAAVIVPSESVKAAAIGWLGVAPDRVHVVPEAPAEAFRRVPSAAEVAASVARHGLEPGFFLAVGALEPRKNLARVVEAIDRLRDERVDARLAVAGPPGWGFGPVAELVRRLDLADRVRFLGFVPDGELRALMSAATGLLYPSLYEGFGLPVVEAMAAGLPVVTSGSGALAELAADAALLVDPVDSDAIAIAIRRLLEDGSLRRRLAERGLTRAAEYSWVTTARQTVAVYRRVAEGKAIR